MKDKAGWAILLAEVLAGEPWTTRHAHAAFTGPPAVHGPESFDKGRLFCFGLGYVGERVAKQLQQELGWQVGGTCSSPSKAMQLRGRLGASVPVWAFDSAEGPLQDEEARAALHDATHVLVTIPPFPPMSAHGADSTSSPPHQFDAVLRHHGQDIMAGDKAWLGYLSSTSVYGDWGGEWVTEDHQLRTDGAGRKIEMRARAEEAWLALRGPPCVHVFRLAGIYGPGRSALDTLARHQGDLGACGVDLSDSSPISRIHVADIVQVLKRSMLSPDVVSQGGAPTLYNVADDYPASRAEVFLYAAQLQGQQQQRLQEDAITLGGSKRRSLGSKRVSNARMKAKFGDLCYPDFRTGLKAILKEGAELS